MKVEEKKLLKNPDFKNVEKQNLIPFHQGGFKKGPVVLCTAKNHTLAHFYRFLTWRQLGDEVCFQMRKNQKMSPQQRSALGIKKM